MKSWAGIKDYISLKFDEIISRKPKFKVVPIKKTRIGTSYGGWAIPSDFINGNSICYSAGAGDDISFDIGLANEYGCKILILDPTPKAFAHFELAKKAAGEGQTNFGIYDNLNKDVFNKLEFVKEGLFNNDTKIKLFFPENERNVSLSLWADARTEAYVNATVRSLPSIMKERGHKSIDLLKIDIEGAEFPVLQDIIDNNIDIKIICIELHKQKTGFDPNIQQTINNLAKAGFCVIDNKNMDFTFVKASSFGLEI